MLTGPMSVSGQLTRAGEALHVGHARSVRVAQNNSNLCSDVDKPTAATGHPLLYIAVHRTMFSRNMHVGVLISMKSTCQELS